MALLLLQANATVTLCTLADPRTSPITPADADILVVAIGKPQ